MKIFFYVSVFLCTLLRWVDCNNCTSGCQTCSNSQSCTTCKTGFYSHPNSPLCQVCKQGCSDCTYSNGYVCNTCLADHQKSGNDCFKCSTNCKTCSTKPYMCDSCNEGQVLQSETDDGITYNKCVDDACTVKDCAECENGKNNICKTCMKGYIGLIQNCFPCQGFTTVCSLNVDIIFDTHIKGFIDLLKTSIGYNSSTYQRTSDPYPTKVDIVDDDLDLYSETDKELSNILYFVFKSLEPEIQKHLFIDQTITFPEVLDILDELINDMRQSTDQSQHAIMTLITKISNQRLLVSHTNKWIFAQMLKQLKSVMTRSECLIGYYLTNNMCNKCPDNCLTCDGSSCSRCKDGFAISPTDSNVCNKCDSPCKQCSYSNQQQVCSSCRPGFKFNSNQECLECKEECSSCTTPTQCQKCVFPYSAYPHATDGCFTCNPPLCKMCEYTDKTKCYECISGYYVSNNWKCVKCPQNCADCLMMGNEVKCKKCNDHFTLEDDECEECGAGCKECSTEDDDICVTCDDGLYPNKQGKCRKCPEICLTCNADRSCTKLRNGLVKVNNLVYECQRGCERCSLPTTCQKCQDYYHKNNNFCQPCPTGCQKCSSATVCQTCKDKYVGISGICHRCQVPKCKKCGNNVNTCQECYRGYKKVNGKCESVCEKGCMICDESNTAICKKCEKGYAMKANNKCAKCVGKCSGSCDPKDINLCVGCVDGFQMKEDKCYQCPDGCLKCTDGSCTTCRPEYTKELSDDKFICKKTCKKPCTKCDRKGCSSCISGFKLNRGRCEVDLSCGIECQVCPVGSFPVGGGVQGCTKCIRDCSSCTSSTECQECFEGFYLNDQKSCTRCGNNCDICKGKDECKVCNRGYLLRKFDENLYDDQCTQCNSNCASCVNFPDQCTSCKEGFRINGTKCISRLVCGFKYVFDVDCTQFMDNSEVDTILSELASITNIPVDLIIINEVKCGSVALSGVVSAENDDQALQISSSLSNGQNQFSYPVTSSSVDLFYDDSDYEVQIHEINYRGRRIGLIIGIVVACIIVIVAIGYGIYKYRHRASHQVDDASSQQDKQPIGAGSEKLDEKMSSNPSDIMTYQ